MGDVMLETERLRLYPLTLVNLVDIEADLALKRFRGSPVTPGLINAQVQKALQIKIRRMLVAEEAEQPWYTFWLILLTTQNLGIGLAGFKSAPNKAGEVEIGYGISEAYEGHGYTTEAVRALLGWGFSQPDCRVITAETLLENLASQRVLEKNGFRRAGEQEGFLFWRLERQYFPLW